MVDQFHSLSHSKHNPNIKRKSNEMSGRKQNHSIAFLLDLFVCFTFNNWNHTLTAAIQCGRIQIRPIRISGAKVKIIFAIGEMVYATLFFCIFLEWKFNLMLKFYIKWLEWLCISLALTLSLLLPWFCERILRKKDIIKSIYLLCDQKEIFKYTDKVHWRRCVQKLGLPDAYTQLTSISSHN